MCSLPVDIEKDAFSVDEMESVEADLIVHEEVPTIPEDIFLKWKNNISTKSCAAKMTTVMMMMTQ
jgi:uncharacterized protein (DUF1697 family)